MRESKLSRRDFLKLGWAAFLGLNVSSLEPFINPEAHVGDNIMFNEVIKHDYVRFLQKSNMRMLGVCGEYLKALKSEDTNAIIEAKKMIILWVLAESASRLGGLTKFPISSALLFHYLNGEGEAVDISSKLVGDAYRSSQLEAALEKVRFEKASNSSSRHDTYSLSDLRQFRAMATSQKGVTYPGVQEGLDWFCAVGNYTENVRTDSVIWRSKDEFDNGNKVVLEINNPNISIYDIYQFNGHFDITPSAYLSRFLQSISPESVKHTIISLSEKIDKMSYISDEVKNTLKQALSYMSEYKYVEDLERIVIGDIELEGRDVALLEKFGANKFEVVGKAQYQGVTSVELDIET